DAHDRRRRPGVRLRLRRRHLRPPLELDVALRVELEHLLRVHLQRTIAAADRIEHTVDDHVGGIMSAAITTLTFPALGTTAQVSVTDAGALSSAVEAVAEELAAIDLACSRFRHDSDLTALNRSAGRPF